jgi:DNA-binding CsgD family transcriptional regulator
MPLTKNSRISATVLARREKVAQAVLRGYTQAEIAKSLSFKQATINIDILWLRQQWLDKAIDKAPEWKAFLIQSQLAIIKECWSAWERSKKNKQIRRIKRPGPDGILEEVTSIEEGQVGDTRYLDQIHKAQVELAKLTGAYEPFQTRLVDEQGKDILSRLVDTLSVDELRTYNATFRKLEDIEAQQKQARIADASVVVPPQAPNETSSPIEPKAKSNGKPSSNGNGKSGSNGHNGSGNGKPTA